MVDNRPGKMQLRAGPFELRFDNGDLRSVKLGSTEVLQRIYFAIRDPYWRTVPARMGEFRVNRGPDSFLIEYDAEDRMEEIEFRRHVKLEGRSDGRIDFTVTGRAGCAFRLNRAGICLLHSSRTWRGRSCRIEHVDGSLEEARFPELISPHQPFQDVRAIRHDIPGGGSVEVRFEGEVFETEDQRNWSDGSFKTYCPPLSPPLPRAMLEGESLRQSVTVLYRGDFIYGDAAGKLPAIRLIGDKSVPIPHIGLGIASHRQPPGETEIARLKSLKLSHLRVDLVLAEPDWRENLVRACREARRLEVSLEAAVSLSGKAEVELGRLAEFVQEVRPPICRWLVFRVGKKTTSGAILSLARRILSAYDPGIPIGGGAFNYFADLNRSRPETGVAEWVCFSLNPQVHAFDNDSLVQTFDGQQDMLETACSFSGGVPIAVTPITLRPRFNPNLAVQEAPGEGRLPIQVDPRQSSLFAAAWTAGSIRSLTEGGAGSLTFYETTGWLGVMDTARGSLLPDRFLSPPGTVYPVYFVLAWLGAFSGGLTMPFRSTCPESVDCLGIRAGCRRHLLVFNLRNAERAVRIHDLPGKIRLKRLHESGLQKAMAEPESFLRQPGEEIHSGSSPMDLSLSPYEVVCLEWEV